MPESHQRIIDASTRSGTFDATTFSGPTWTVGYDPTGVFLDPTPDTSSTTTSITSTITTTTLPCVSALHPRGRSDERCL